VAATLVPVTRSRIDGTRGVKKSAVKKSAAKKTATRKAAKAPGVAVTTAQ
jgi:hypothetical protein